MPDMTLHIRCSLALALFLVSACVAESPARQGFVVRDSAGVRIVENANPVWRDGVGWHVTPEPVVEIGGGDSEHDHLFGMISAVRLADGRLVVANGNQELWFYDDRGVFLTAAGGRGEGPGEFRDISQLVRLPGDTLLVHEWWRLTWFDAQGGYVRGMTFNAGGFAAHPALLTHEGGAFAVNLRSRPRPLPMGVSTITNTWVLLAVEGGAVDTIGSFPVGQGFTTRRGGRTISYPGPFVRRLYAPAMGARGLFFGDATAFEVSVYSYGAELVEILRKRHTPTPVGSDEVAEFRRQFLEGVSERSRGGRERWLADVPYPEVMPALGRLMVDGSQNLWAQVFAPRGSMSTVWNVFDEEGRWLGKVEFPEGLMVREIGDDYVLGLWRDADDVQHVRMYDLVKGESG